MYRIIFTYITTNLLDGKQYIGSHATDNIDDGYLGSGEMLINAVRKHGESNFKREIIDFYYSRKEAYIAEGVLIERFQTIRPNGYNISPIGGMFVPGYESKWKGVTGDMAPRYGKPASKDIRERISRRMKNRSRKSAPFTREQKKKVGYAVLQLTMDGSFVKEWGSVSLAADYIGCSKAGITACARGDRGSCFGYKWKYKYIHGPGLRKIRNIEQSDLNGNVIRIWPDAKTASQSTDVGVGNILGCINGHAHTAGGYIWKKEELKLAYRDNGSR